MASVFDYFDYFKYLRAYLASLPKHGHGIRAKMAEAINCEAGYISRVLKGKAHLSLEQADALSRFLEHSSDEHSYFILMVQRCRAGTKSLEAHFQKQMTQIVERRLIVRNRVSATLPLNLEQQTRYFSHWHFAALHALVSIPEFQTRERLLEHLRIHPRRLNEVLDFLVAAGLIKSESGRYKVGETRIQLTGDSPLIGKHHANWRHRAIQAIDDEPDQGLHYSSAMTMSAKDYDRLREKFIQTIKEMNAIVQDSKDETAVSFVLDFYEF